MRCAKAARIINVNRRSSPGFSRGDGDKYEKSAYTSEYQISVELKFCNIEASLSAIYRDNKLSSDGHVLRDFARSERIVIVNFGYLNLWVRYRARIPPPTLSEIV